MQYMKMRIIKEYKKPELKKSKKFKKFEILEINNIFQIKNSSMQEFFDKGEDVALSTLEWWNDNSLTM